MAWRIHDHVVRGEIDNRVRGRVTGRVWLAGVSEPLVLDLDGDCEPDLAGCLLEFENPAPVPIATRPPMLEQKGTAGNITAARKVRVLELPIEEAYPKLKRGEKVPEHMANSVYLEWYSARSGRVVIESTDYRLQISAPVWRFSAEELAERERRAAEDSSAFAIEVHADGTIKEWDEFRCEQLLRESDMTGEKYRRLLEKYADHPDSERIIAHEMGWTKFYEALDALEASSEAHEEAEESLEAEDEMEFEEEPPDPEREGIDWVPDPKEEGVIHPVAKHARDTMYALLHEVKKGDRDLSESDDVIGAFTGQFMVLSVKLSSALSFVAQGDRFMDPGMVIAWLKRALEIQNDALMAADALRGHSDFSAERLDYYRAELFRIREWVIAVIARLRDAR